MKLKLPVYLLNYISHFFRRLVFKPVFLTVKKIRYNLIVERIVQKKRDTKISIDSSFPGIIQLLLRGRSKM